MKKKIRCGYCRAEIIEGAVKCPKCTIGFSKERKEPVAKDIIKIFIIILISAFVGAFFILPLGFLTDQIDQNICLGKHCMTGILFFPFVGVHDGGYGLLPLFVGYGALVGAIIGALILVIAKLIKKNEK